MFCLFPILFFFLFFPRRFSLSLSFPPSEMWYIGLLFVIRFLLFPLVFLWSVPSLFFSLLSIEASQCKWFLVHFLVLQNRKKPIIV
jgi:hypothetical protein